MPEFLEIPLSAVNEWLIDETISIIEPIREEAQKILQDIKEKLEELSEASEKLLDDAEKEMAKGSRKTYRRSKLLSKLAGIFSDLIDKINLPKEITGKNLNETSEQFEKTINKIGQEKAKWFRAISPYFILSRRRFEVSFKRAEDSLETFNNFLAEDYAKAQNVENIPIKIDNLRQYLRQLENSEKAQKMRTKKKKRIETTIKKIEQKLQKFQTKEEVIELTQINSKIEELTKKVNHEFRHIRKPLLKFQTLVNNPGYSLLPDKKAKLDEYLENPFNALATEKEGHPLLNNILQKIEKALETKKMKLKSSRLRKAKNQINHIVNNATLLSLQKDSSETFNKKNELSKSGVISNTKNQKEKLQDQLKELQRRKKILVKRDSRFDKQLKDVQKIVEEQKRSLEDNISEISGKKILILIK
jgi:hypothetical protein